MIEILIILFNISVFLGGSVLALIVFANLAKVIVEGLTTVLVGIVDGIAKIFRS